MPITFDAPSMEVRLTDIKYVQVWCYDRRTSLVGNLQGLTQCSPNLPTKRWDGVVNPNDLDGASYTLATPSSDGGNCSPHNESVVKLEAGWVWYIQGMDCNGTYWTFSKDLWCRADINHNGFVNGEDANDFLALFESGVVNFDKDEGMYADVDRNGFLNGDDADIFWMWFDTGGC